MEAKTTPGGAVAGRKVVHAAPHPVRRSTSAKDALLFATLSCAALLACGDNSTVVGVLPETPPPATAAELADAQIRVVSGDSQEGEVASVLSDSLVVEVTRSSGAPLGGAPVEWVFDAGHPPLAGGATIPDQRLVAITDRNGRASTLWQLGTSAGDQSVSARLMVPESPAQVSGGPSLAPGDFYSWFWGRARPGTAYSLTVTPAAVSRTEGDSVQLAAQVKDRYGNVLQGRTVGWTSTAQAVAVTDQTGMVRALSPGSATIRATSGSVSGTSALTVTARVTDGPPTLTVRQNSVVVQSLSLVTGTSASLTVTATNSEGVSLGTITPTWSSSNSGVASISAQGVVQALVVGSTNLVASYQGATNTIPTTVTAGNSPPTATISAPTQNPTVTLGTPVTFQGSANDSDGTIVSYAWSFGNGGTSNVRNPGAYTYQSTGVYAVTFSVTDNGGATSQLASRTVTVVAAGNSPPTATITAPTQNLTVTLGTPVTFQGNATDTDGTIATHSWTFGDGGTSAVANPGARTYLSIGVYAVTYRATDDDGATSPPANRTVTVAAVAPPPPPGGARTFLWTSDWNAATGNSLSAIQANGQWTDRACVGGAGVLIRVVNTAATLPSPPAHWPTNVLQVDHNGQNCDNIIVQNRWPAPAIGDTIWFRVLAYPNKCGLNTGPVHNVQSNIGSIAWIISEDQCQGTSVPIGFKSYFLGGGTQWVGQNVAASTYLRYEWGLIRESTTRYDALVRVYNDRTGALIFDETTLRRDTGQTLAAYNATSGFTYSGVGPDVTFRSWMLGQQGPGGGASGQRTGAYNYGGAAVCNPGPCGPYARGEGT